MTSTEHKQLQRALDRGEFNGVVDCFTTNPRQAFQFHTKREAVTWAKKIGWFASDVQRTEVMGFRLWVVADDHGRMVTARGFLRFLNARS